MSPCVAFHWGTNFDEITYVELYLYKIQMFPHNFTIIIPTLPLHCGLDKEMWFYSRMVGMKERPFLDPSEWSGFPHHLKKLQQKLKRAHDSLSG